jgi:serine protease Do
MSGVRVSLVGISAALTIAASLLGSAPARADYAFENAQAAFEREPVDDRVRLQLLLAAGGYLTSMPLVQFGRHAFDGIQAFQQDNDFAPTGDVEDSPDEMARLRRVAGQMLDVWGFTVIQHPNSQVRLWIPGALGLNRHPNRYGYVYDDPAKRIGLQFMSFPNLDVAASYRSTLKWFAEQGAYVHYKVAKDDWYVVSASTPDGQDWYARYHQDGAATTGFTLAWNNANGNIHGERIATLMSASLWADRTGAPMLTPWQSRRRRRPPRLRSRRRRPKRKGFRPAPASSSMTSATFLPTTT